MPSRYAGACRWDSTIAQGNESISVQPSTSDESRAMGHSSSQARLTWTIVVTVAGDLTADDGSFQTVHQANEAPSCLVFLFCLSVLFGRSYLRRLGTIGFTAFRTCFGPSHEVEPASNVHAAMNQ